jgi:hypothetical protein
VRATWRAVRLARLAESVLLGATALSIGLTAAVLSGERGAPVRSWGDAWLAAFVCAVCCALSWWVEHRPRPADVAARIDTKLRLSGALVTAFELEAVRVPGAASSGIGRLLLERVTRRVTRKDGLRVALPRSGKFLALPLIAAGLLAGALDMRREEPPPVPLDRLLAGLAGEAAALGAGTSTDFAAGDLTAEEVRAALDLAARAGRLELSAGAGPLDPQEREELAREAELLQGELQELSTRLPPDSETARAAERAASWAEVAGTGGRDPDRAPAAAPDVAPDEAPHETGQGESDGSGGLEVAAGPADGTMLGSPAELGDPFDGSGGAASPAPESAREERGVVAGRWWPARYDSVVERWVEVRRARLRSESR